MFNFSLFPIFSIFLATIFALCTEVSAGCFYNKSDLIKVKANPDHHTGAVCNEKILQRSIPVKENVFLIPGYHRYTAEKDIIEDFSEGLVKYDKTGKVVPAVAYKWEVSKDGLCWTFFLRENAFYSDGQRVTAHDFVETLKRNFLNAQKVFLETESIALNIKIRDHLESLCVYSSKVKNASEILKNEASVEELGISAVNDFTLKIQLEVPQKKELFLMSIAAPAAWAPVRPEIEQSIFNPEVKKTEQAYPSNGAFYISKIVQGEKIVLKKNPYYWNAEKISLDGVIYHVLPNPKQRLNKWLNQELDYLLVSKSAEKYEISAQDKESEWNFLNASGYAYFVCNKNSAYRKNKKIREAFAILLDRDCLKQSCYSSPEESNYGILSSYYGDFNKAEPYWANLTLQERYKKIRTILKNLGYSKKNPLSLRICTYITGSQFQEFEQYFLGVSKYIPELICLPQHFEPQDLINRISDSDDDHSYDFALIAKSVSAPQPFSLFKTIRLATAKDSFCACKKIVEHFPEAINEFKHAAKENLHKQCPKLNNFFEQINVSKSELKEACLPWCKNNKNSIEFSRLFFKQSHEKINTIYNKGLEIYQNFSNSQFNDLDVFFDEYDYILNRIVVDDSLTIGEEAALYARLDEILINEWFVLPLCTFPSYSIQKNYVKGIDGSERDITGRFPSEEISLLDKC